MGLILDPRSLLLAPTISQVIKPIKTTYRRLINIVLLLLLLLFIIIVFLVYIHIETMVYLYNLVYLYESGFCIIGPDLSHEVNSLYSIRTPVHTQVTILEKTESMTVMFLRTITPPLTSLTQHYITLSSFQMPLVT